MPTLLFLCVANSARSQMAEGLARHMAPPGLYALSAGSKPTSVRPEAIQVLGEMGVDTSMLRSKPVSSIDPDSVDLVVTLCAEEECPLFLGLAPRLHWPLPDPAAAQGSLEERLEAFRQVRDELIVRLRPLFERIAANSAAIIV